MVVLKTAGFTKIPLYVYLRVYPENTPTALYSPAARRCRPKYAACTANRRHGQASALSASPLIHMATLVDEESTVFAFIM